MASLKEQQPGPKKGTLTFHKRERITFSSWATRVLQSTTALFGRKSETTVDHADDRRALLAAGANGESGGGVEGEEDEPLGQLPTGDSATVALFEDDESSSGEGGSGGLHGVYSLVPRFAPKPSASLLRIFQRESLSPESPGNLR